MTFNEDLDLRDEIKGELKDQDFNTSKGKKNILKKR
jgi:hypothetical protein